MTKFMFPLEKLKIRDDFYKDVITQLENERIKQCITRSDLEYKVGMPRGYLQRIVVGDYTPKFYMLHCWAEALGGEIKFISGDNNE